ncbi:hypothetical protein C7N43_04405 [Sphingobacteriales bacterium UPWRP_1]|nr:hypothetical protein C7N43_04405 [Sphingobacteriales bacterium UPWRP_1]
MTNARLLLNSRNALLQKTGKMPRNCNFLRSGLFIPRFKNNITRQNFIFAPLLPYINNSNS